MAKITIDNSKEIFGDKVTIADLAANSTILALDSDELNIYLVQAAMEIEWPFEIEQYEYEYCTGYSATFRDGSRISVGAWAEGDDSFWYSRRGDDEVKRILANLEKKKTKIIA